MLDDVAKRVELSLAGKEVDEKTRRESDTFSMERKFLDVLKRKLKKKRTIADAAKQVYRYIAVVRYLTILRIPQHQHIEARALYC